MERISCDWQNPSEAIRTQFPESAAAHQLHGDPAHIGECDAWTCVWGNQPHLDGFEPCLEDGTPVEPLADGPWTHYWLCAQCGRIIDQRNGEVTGRAPAVDGR